MGGALGFQGQQSSEGFHEGVFGGDAVTGKRVEAGDVGRDGKGCEGFVVEAVDRAGFADRCGDNAHIVFLGRSSGLVFDSEGFEEGVKFRRRGLSGGGAVAVFAGVAAGRSFPEDGSRAGAASSISSVGGDAGGAGSHASSYFQGSARCQENRPTGSWNFGLSCWANWRKIFGRFLN